MSAPRIGCPILEAAKRAFHDPAKRFDASYERHCKWFYIRESSLDPDATVIDLATDSILTDSEVMATPLDRLAIRYRDTGECSKSWGFLAKRHPRHSELLRK